MNLGNIKNVLVGHVAHFAEFLSSMHKAPSKSLAAYDLGTVLHTCNLFAQEVEAGESEVQFHQGLLSEIEASQNYMRQQQQQQKKEPVFN